MKTFILGVGAQKAGTTWLYSYLNRHPNINMGILKEYHIFDQLFNSDKSETAANTGGRSISKIGNELRRERALMLRERFLKDPNTYFDYFQKLLKRDENIYFTGDMTPNYSSLPEGALNLIKKELFARGIILKVIFLMRDPFERCLSAIRHNLRNSDIEITEKKEINRLKLAYKTENFIAKTRYENTITTLEKVFTPDQIFYAFYEELFSSNEILRLCSFLNLQYAVPDFEKRVNVSLTETLIPEELKFEIVNFYSSTYEYMFSKFGREQILSLWENAAFLQTSQSRV